MKNFKEIRENVKTADKKPEIYTKPDGKKGTRMVPVDKEVIKQEKTLEWNQHTNVLMIDESFKIHEKFQ